jgi:hypothetical protein
MRECARKYFFSLPRYLAGQELKKLLSIEKSVLKKRDVSENILKTEILSRNTFKFMHTYVSLAGNKRLLMFSSRHRNTIKFKITK